MMKTPSCYPRWQQYKYVPRYPYFVTGWGHRKIEPKTKHFSHCKNYQSSWPNQTNNSKRLAKIWNHAYKNSETIQIIFIDNLIINPQFIGSRQTHRKRVLHRIDLHEDHEEHGIEEQRERRSHLATSYGPEGLRWTTHASSGGQWSWCRCPPWSNPPPPEYRKRSPDGISKKQRLAAAEKVFWLALCWFPDFREFIGLELGQTEQAWAHKLPGRPPGRSLVACAPRFCLLALSRNFQGLFCPEKNHQKVSWHLDFVWYWFPGKPKTSRKQQLALGTRLIG